MNKYLFILFFSLFTLSSFSQSRKRTFRQSELGFYGGASYYIGDLNNRTHFIYSKPAYGIFYRFSSNYRSAFRFGFNYGQIAASDAQSKEPYQKERNLGFQSKVYELHALAEFNFVEYRIGHDKHKFTLFVFGGLAGYYFDPQSNGTYGDGSLTTYPSEGKTYPKYQLSVPFGVGFKLNLGRLFGVGIEWGPRRTFTDYLDDVSGTYPDNVNSGAEGTPDVSQQGGVSPGAMRGDPSMKDWYFFYGINLNLKLPDPHKKCHGSGRGRG